MTSAGSVLKNNCRRPSGDEQSIESTVSPVPLALPERTQLIKKTGMQNKQALLANDLLISSRSYPQLLMEVIFAYTGAKSNQYLSENRVFPTATPQHASPLRLSQLCRKKPLFSWTSGVLRLRDLPLLDPAALTRKRAATSSNKPLEKYRLREVTLAPKLPSPLPPH